MPTITKAYLDSVLVGRVSDLLTQLGMSVLVDGTNPDTIDAITSALGSIGSYPVTLGSVVQSDLDGIDLGSLAQIQDVAEYRLLGTIYSRVINKVTVRVGSQSEVDWSDMAKNIKDRMSLLKKDIDGRYSNTLGFLIPGTIRLNKTTRFTDDGYVYPGPPV